MKRQMLVALLTACFVISPSAFAGLRESQPTPGAGLLEAVSDFKKKDATASFSYFAGQVDRFSAAPKATVPAYSLTALRQQGLSTTTRSQPKVKVTSLARTSQNLDADMIRKMPFPVEGSAADTGVSYGLNDPPEDGGQTMAVPREHRILPSLSPEVRPAWTRPSDATLAREQAAAKPILAAFLAMSPSVFGVGSDQTSQGLPTLRLARFHSGRLGRMAVFEQTYNGHPILDGDVGVMFDVNWNIVAISRMIITPTKLPADSSVLVSQQQAVARAKESAAMMTRTAESLWSERSSTLGLDPVRRAFVYRVKVSIPEDAAHNVTAVVSARSGSELAVWDNTMAYTDAQVRRWTFTNGYLDQPSQIVADGFYTRDDDTLVHDFFYMMNDDRYGGNPQGTCTSTTKDTAYTEDAYGTRSGGSYIRGTIRNDRDFSLWDPDTTRGTFAESNSYYWARWYMQWQKSALDELGLLPASASDYPKVLMVMNSCYSAPGVYFDEYDDFPITTLSSTAETLPRIILRERCRAMNGNCDSSDVSDAHPDAWQICEESGCHPSPGTVQHELNHFVMDAYLGVGYGVDCGTEKELSYLHEGALGSALPQAYWDFHYGIEYDPDEEQLYKGDMDAGLVHSSSSTKLTISALPCGTTDSYEAGRVAGQALREIIHGKQVIGSTVSSMERPDTDTDAQFLTYLAAWLTRLSTIQDRTQLAEWFMLLAKYSSSASSSGLSDWCDVFEDHGMSIPSDYCS